MMLRRRDHGRSSGDDGEEADRPSCWDGALILPLSEEEYERGFMPGGVAEDWGAAAESETATPLAVVDGPDGGDGVGPGRSEEPWRCWAHEGPSSAAGRASSARQLVFREAGPGRRSGGGGE